MLLRRLWVAFKRAVVAVKARLSLETASSPGFLVAATAPRPTLLKYYKLLRTADRWTAAQKCSWCFGRRRLDIHGTNWASRSRSPGGEEPVFMRGSLLFMDPSTVATLYLWLTNPPVQWSQLYQRPGRTRSPLCPPSNRTP